MTLRHALKATERSLIHATVRTTVRVGSALAPNRTAQSIARRFFATARPPLARRQFRGDKPAVDVRAVPDGQVTTYRWGDAQRPTVLLTAGSNGFAQPMAPFVAAPAEHGFSVLAFDHVAHGATEGHA